MNCNLHKITYSAIRILLLVRLIEAICLQGDVAETESVLKPFKAELKASKEKYWGKLIPLKLVKNATFLVTYQSSIALKLCKGAAKDTVIFADQIATQFHNPYLKSWADDFQITKFLLREFTVKASDRGELEFGLSDQGLAAWLQFFIGNPFPVPSAHLPLALSKADRDSLFSCQHAHARCCSLLRMSDEAGFIKLGGEPSNWLLAPDPIPWLTLNTQRLHPFKRELIFQIVATVDDLCDPALENKQAYLKRAIALSQAFQRFYGACRIFGEPIEISQLRLGLVLATQKGLRSLLQGVGADAPGEL